MSSDLATDLQHGRPRDLGGARGEHRCDGDGFEPLDHVGPGHPLVGQRLERGADAASLMERTSTAVVAAPPAVVDVLGDVGEEREPRECPDHVECVFDAEVAQCGAQLVSRIAAHHPRTDGGASDPLDQFERRRTSLGPDHIAQHPAEEADVGVEQLVGAVAHRATLWARCFRTITAAGEGSGTARCSATRAAASGPERTNFVVECRWERHSTTKFAAYRLGSHRPGGTRVGPCASMRPIPDIPRT